MCVCLSVCADELDDWVAYKKRELYLLVAVRVCWLSICGLMSDDQDENDEGKEDR